MDKPPSRGELKGLASSQRLVEVLNNFRSEKRIAVQIAKLGSLWSAGDTESQQTDMPAAD